MEGRRWKENGWSELRDIGSVPRKGLDSTRSCNPPWLYAKRDKTPSNGIPAVAIAETELN